MATIAATGLLTTTPSGFNAPEGQPLAYQYQNPPDVKYYKNKYGYVLGSDGKPLDDFVYKSLADNSMTESDFKDTTVKNYSEKAADNYDWSGLPSGAKDKFIKDVASGVINPNNLSSDPAPKKVAAPSGKILDYTDKVAEKTGMLDTKTGGLDTDKALPTKQIEYGTDQQKQAMDGVSTYKPATIDANDLSFIDTQKINKEGTTAFAQTGVGGVVTRDTTKIGDSATINVNSNQLAADAIANLVSNLKSQNIAVDENQLSASKIDALASNLKARGVNVDKNQLSAEAVKALAKELKSVDVAVDNNSLVSNRLSGLLSANNPYLQDARNQATLQSSRRGLLNSGAAAGYAQDAAIKAGYQIAHDDASVYAAAQLANAQAKNQLQNTSFNAQANAIGQDAQTYAEAERANALADNQLQNTAFNARSIAIGKDAQTYADAEKANALAANTLTNTAFNAQANAIGQDAQTYANAETANAQLKNAITLEQARLDDAASSDNSRYINTQNAADVADQNRISIANANTSATINSEQAKINMQADSVNSAAANDVLLQNVDSLNKALSEGTIAKNTIWNNVNQNTYDSLTKNAGFDNDLSKLLNAGQIDLATNLASNMFTASENATKFERDQVLANLNHTLKLDEMSVTDGYEKNNLKFEAATKMQLALDDRTNQALLTIYDSVTKANQQIGLAEKIDADTKTAMMNQNLMMGAYWINLMSKDGVIRSAEIINDSMK